MSANTNYAWYADDELVVMMNRYVARAPSSELASTKLKAWLGQEFLGAPAPAPIEARRGPGRPRKVRLEPPAPSSTPTVSAPPAPPPPSGPRVYLTRKEASAYLGVSVKTMGNWASDGRGPPFTRRGGVRYYQDELDVWRAGERFEGE